MGGALARYAEEGVGVYLVCATRGENGRCGDGHKRLSPEEVGPIRERELRAAANELGVREVTLLGYQDGALDRADPREVTARIAHQLRRVRPQVVVTFGPEGAYGHPDHIAVCQLATAAVVSAAAPCGRSSPEEPHQVSKLYYMAWPPEKWVAYQAAFRDLKSVVDGVERRAVPWPDWAVTTVLDTRSWWPQVWRAICCHRSQLAIYAKLEHLPAHEHEYLWGSQEFYRAFSLVNGGRRREDDLFAGLRGRADRVEGKLP
jgi:LmbE family N-acetylglucosaminyl deacetylase